jgi:D-alanine--poly(phosphoribitol) ligase subunit 1
MNYNVALPFFQASERFPDNPALVTPDRRVSYLELRRFVQRTARWLQDKAEGRVTRVGILASRSIETYGGILATCWAGGAYVPLSVNTPEDRLVRLLEQIDLQALIVGREGLRHLSERVIRACPKNILTAFDNSGGAFNFDMPRVETGATLPAYDQTDEPATVAAEDSAYILFTSGTTGAPKGVVIPAGAVAHFVEMMNGRYELEPSDRIAAITDITFDLSVFDMFCAWSRGASVWIVPTGQVMAPIHFIQTSSATVAFTVPSVGAWMNRMKLLTPGSMPSLRYFLLAGEPLPVSVAAACQRAAPNARIDNLYGPTEATVVCTGQQFSGPADATPRRDVVSIGPALPGSEIAVVDEKSKRVVGRPGEIFVAGPQLASGYFRDEEQTARHFVEWNEKRWYRTGDLGFEDPSGKFHHLGRIDNQVKVRGMRVELEEVESHLRAVYQTDLVAAVAWPVEHGSAAGIIGFVTGPAPAAASDEKRRAQLKSQLPAYMVPTEVHHVSALPLNANGKVDRKALLSKLSG